MRFLRLIPVWLIVFPAIWFTSGCVQRETDIGRDALQNVPEDEFLVVEGTATNSIVWNPFISNGRGKSLQVGDADEFNAFFAVRFNPIAALPESARVDCMVVHLRRNRIWPESNAPNMQLSVREIPEYWTEDSLLPGYLSGHLGYPELLSLWMTATDSSVSFTIPDSLQARWLSGDSTTFGLLFEPLTTGALLDFYSSESFDTVGSQGPTLEMYGQQWRLVDSVWTDTALVVKQAAVHDAYLATDSTEMDSTRLALSQGRAQRGALYFPLDSIASANFTRAVNHAELYLYADNGDPRNVLYSGVGLLYKDGTMTDTDWITEPDSARAELVAISSSAFNSTNEYVKFDVSSTVAHWISYPDSNGGFQVMTSEENGHLTRQIFHSALSEDSTKRPRLKLWLTDQR